MQDASDLKQMQEPSIPSHSSRRKFLQGAAIATATAAAAAATGTVLVKAANDKHAIQTFDTVQGLISGATSGGCTTNTTSPFSPISQITSGNGEHQFMLWFWANNLPESPTGITYTLSIAISKVSGGGPTPGAFPDPFSYSGAGNDQHNYVLDDGKAACPGTVPTPNGNGNTLTDIQSVTLTGPTSTRQDILWQLHLNWSGADVGTDTIYQFTGTISDGMGNTVSSSVNLTVTA